MKTKAEKRLALKPEVRKSLAALTAMGLFALAACGGGVGMGDQQASPAGASPPPSAGSNASFIVDTAWAPNSDNPDGYLVYIGPTASSATTLVKTLAKGAPDWNPVSPSAQLASSDVAAALATATQACVAVRAFNGGGVSLPSQATCAALP